MTEKTKAPISEEKTAAASYILQFYQEVQNLNHWHASYLNLMTELKKKYADFDHAKLEEHEKTAIGETVQNVRYYATKSFVQYQVIIKSAAKNLKVDKEVIDSYVKVRDTYIILQADLDKYVIGLNMFLMTGIVKNLLESSQDFMAKVFTTPEA